MDKKRRNQTSIPTGISLPNKMTNLHQITELIALEEKCGIVSKRFQFLQSSGVGSFTLHQFEGLSISIFDVLLSQDLYIEGELSKDILEMSFLLEGEQIIQIEGFHRDLIYESQECYLLFLNPIKGTICYHKRKRLKELKIRMSIEFIKRHQLHTEYHIMERYALSKQKEDFVKLLCSKTQEILSEILTDNRKGLLKRLFLEAKILELIGLKLDLQPTYKPEAKNQLDNLVKKLYEIQHIISSDLSTQYSIQQLSRLIGLNDFVLKKEFKRVFGTTIFEYALKLRMEKACNLLRHSKKPIYEISELVGYKNATHFTAAFKKNLGTTPKKYRDTSPS